MQFDRADPGHDRIATFDIESTHYKPDLGEIVSVGVGVHDRGDLGQEATFDTFHRNGDGEAAVVRQAMARLAEYDADVLVSYKGIDFDLSFIRDRLDRLDETADLPAVATDADRHVDLFFDRKRRADQRGRKWPSLEECLDAYGCPCPKTLWNGGPVTNTRFGEELGPAYLQALDEGTEQAGKLTEVIDHYLTTDLEANLAIYYGDIGAKFEPNLLDSERSF